MKSRIRLLKAEMKDLDFIVDIDSDKVLWNFENDIITDKEIVRKKVVDRLQSQWYKQFLIALSDSSVIGKIDLHWYVKDRESWEIGYCILPEYRGNGYCVEAVKMAFSYVFDECKAHKVVAMCNEYNIASYKVMEKAGMSREGVFRKELFWNGVWADQFFYSILEEEYYR